MLQLLQVETALLFGVISYFVTSFIYGKSTGSTAETRGLTKLYMVLALVVGLGAIKVVRVILLVPVIIFSHGCVVFGLFSFSFLFS